MVAMSLNVNKDNVMIQKNDEQLKLVLKDNI